MILGCEIRKYVGVDNGDVGHFTPEKVNRCQDKMRPCRRKYMQIGQKEALKTSGHSYVHYWEQNAKEKKMRAVG